MSRFRSALGLWVGLALVAGGAPRSSDAVERRAASDFHRRASIEGEVKRGEAYAVALTRETVSALRKGGEVRLFDAAGREIPSLVHDAVRHSEVVDRPASIFNRAWQPDGVQTLSVQLTARTFEAVNEFVFEIADPEYNARVRVEGSDDGEGWQILGDGLHLIRHHVQQENIRYVHDVVRVPTARWRFYRFTLRPETPPQETFVPLGIESIKVRRRVARGATLAVPVALARDEDDRDPDARHHYWKLDLGREDLGVDRVVVAIPAQDFARAASLWEWSPERKRRTRRLASAVLFRYGSDVQNEISGFSTDARVLALMLEQGDDEPVEVTSVRASRPQQQVRFLVAQPLELPLALYFDPEAPRKPRYDLARRLKEREITSFGELKLGALEANPNFAEAPLPRSERVPYLLYALVIPLVVGLGWYVARTIQRGVPSEEP